MEIEKRKHRAEGFKIIFEELDKLDRDDCIIVETGTIRKDSPDGDGNALLLFEEYLENKIGRIFSIDIDHNAVNYARTIVKNKTIISHNDSVKWLINSLWTHSISLLYLDSLDFDGNNPEISAIHHLNEILAVYNKGHLRNCIVAIDDNFEPYYGKGMLVRRFLELLPSDILKYDGYIQVWKIL